MNKRTKILPVTSKSIGVSSGSESKVENVIFKYATLPVDVSKTYFINNLNQEIIEIQIFENELQEIFVEKSDSQEIGKCIIGRIPTNLPIGSPIQVTFKINEEGRLDIHAIEMTGKKELNLTLETTSVISGQELEEAKERRSKAIKLS